MSVKILIADDEPNILISLKYLMKREGYEVHVARDGEQAMAQLREHRPRLLLLDVMMPKKTGFEVCQEVRADDTLRGTLILMLTAKGRETDVVKGLALGANAYMTKPFSTRELVNKVAELLESNGVKRDRRLVRWLLVVGLTTLLALALWALALVVLIGSALAPAARETVASWLGPQAPLAVMALLALAGAVVALVAPLYRHFVAAPARLLERVRVLLETDAVQPLAAQGSAENRGLADAINRLVEQRERLRADTAAEVDAASRRVEQERNRLAALMSELTQSVVVCNLDGRILLYNPSARRQFRALSQTPELAGGAELIGLGRSIYAVIDRQLVAHALERIGERLQRADVERTAQFVTTTRSGQLLRAMMAPVLGTGSETELDGFVLMLDNITDEYERDSAQDQLLLGLTEGSRASLGNMQAALELLDDPQLDTATRDRFLAVVRDEMRTMAARLHELSHRSAQEMKTRWPLEEMLGAELVAAARRRIEATWPLRTGTDGVDDTLWLKVDSFALMQVLSHLAGRLASHFELRTVQLSLSAAEGRAQLDLIWSGPPASTETLTSWESEAMHEGVDAAAPTSALSVRDVMQRHGGEFWFERDRIRQRSFFRLLLPLADAANPPRAATRPQHDSRPEFYDFDLFQVSEAHHALDERRLTELSYTVFDTETTGLAPSEGDEIIQIGAARIVNGKLLRQECFEQLIDPQRTIPAAGIPIHGIRPEMVQGQPIIDAVLPAFQAFARDTVLVAHNAAFDMRFLQLKEARTGIRFDQPVLDTLLLSALVHPNQESHRLEEIAARFDIPVIGRHTALGDAIVTAEVLLKLIPLLAATDIHTLRQAREAAQQTYYARIRY